MARLLFISLLSFTMFPCLITAISSCWETCKTNDDCDWKLICTKGECLDDPQVGSHACHGNGHFPSRVTGATRAILTYNDFSKGGDGGGAAECDGQYHEKNERVVALSTGWYARGNRCGEVITIRARNGRTATAIVVDECDSRNGCKKNIVNASGSVWEDLGLDINIGEVSITWSMMY